VTAAGEPARIRHRLPAGARLRSAREFRRVYQRGRRQHGRLVTLVGFFARTGKGARLGVSVSKDHGGAVRRNKLKRILREAFRLERHGLPPQLDLVVIPRQQDGRLELAAVRQELVRLVQRLAAEASAPERQRSRRP
jgi:ribonuclease P protein component